MRQSVQRRVLVSSMLLCLLVVAEALAVTHALDFEAHAPGEVCKICVGVADLGGAAPARAPLLLPPAAAEPVPFTAVVSLPAARNERPSARGPPSPS